jgi:hypothetical protein
MTNEKPNFDNEETPKRYGLDSARDVHFDLRCPLHIPSTLLTGGLLAVVTYAKPSRTITKDLMCNNIPPQ